MEVWNYGSIFLSLGIRLKVMKEELVTFETAKLAKEKGFDVPQNMWWYNRFGVECGRTDVDEDGNHLYYGSGTYVSEPKRNVSKEYYEKQTSISFQAPTQSLLQKWLREKHNIEVFVNPYKDYFADVNDPVMYKYCVWNNSIGAEFSEIYEEALETGLQRALKLI